MEGSWPDMTSRDFCYWLQGYFELTNPQELSVRETTLIKQHLNLVFKHEIDPSVDGGNPAVAAELQAIHDGKLLFNKPHAPTDVVVRC